MFSIQLRAVKSNGYVHPGSIAPVAAVELFLRGKRMLQEPFAGGGKSLADRKQPVHGHEQRSFCLTEPAGGADRAFLAQRAPVAGVRRLRG